MEVETITDYFCFIGKLVRVEATGFGHIHDTYTVTCAQHDGEVRRYILQKINRTIFQDPESLMQNIERVTRHLQSKIEASGGDPFRETLTLVPAVDNRSFYCDPEGDTWRAYLYIEGARTYETAQNQGQIVQAARAYGKFQSQLDGFPASELVEIIPGFHDTPRRFEAFMDAVKCDRANRAGSVREEIAFIVRREAQTRVLVEMLERSELPLRVTHNDTKLNNVMIDDRTGKGICVLDLDTVMPGSALYDFGDMVRSAAALTVEDDPISARAGLSLESFESLTRGYLHAGRGFLCPGEIDQLAFSARLITLEQAIRFLTDYLNGDAYYKVQRPGHNLERARTQIAMATDMEKKAEQMRSIVARYR